MKTIIVGNAPIVPSKLGKQIDKFDTVIRINDFITKGHEEDVGSKTDIWFFTCLYWEKFKDIISYYPEPWIVTLSEEYQYPGVRNIPIKIAQRELQYPSTGMVAIYAALVEFGSPIHIIGFNGFDKNHSHHYFKDKVKRGKNAHNGQKEMQMINQMICSNKLIKLNNFVPFL